MNIKIVFGYKFQKDLKKYSKKFRTLDKDLEFLLTVIKDIPKGNKSKHWNIIKESSGGCVFKVRLACKSENKGAAFRVIYFYDNENIYLEFIELYHKPDKAREDNERIKEIYKKYNIE